MTEIKNLILENESLNQAKLDLEVENKELKARNEFLERCVKGLKLNINQVTTERNEALDKLHKIQQMSMFEFGNTYCSDASLEADGHALARSLGIGGK